MTDRGMQLHAAACGQTTELLALSSTLNAETLRLPCPGREKLGDGTIAASLRHTADNYQRIAAFVQTSDADRSVPGATAPNSGPRCEGLIGDASTATTTSLPPGSGTSPSASSSRNSPLEEMVDRRLRPRVGVSSGDIIRTLSSRRSQPTETSRHDEKRDGDSQALDDLTPHEPEIARLASEGLSNADIGARLITPRTGPRGSRRLTALAG